MQHDEHQPAQRSARMALRRAGFAGGAKRVFIALLALVLLGWGSHWLYLRWTHIHVDDARVDGEVITLSSRVSGWITELSVVEGDYVKKGQVLARVDERDAVLKREVLLEKQRAIEGQMAVMRAQTGQVDQETLGKYQSENSRLVAAEAEVASLQVQLAQTREDYKRAQDVEQFLTRQEVDRARTAYQQTQENLNKAQAEVAAVRGMLSAAGGSRRQIHVIERQLLVLAHQAGELHAELRRQEIDIADRTILSPGDGRVVMTFVRKGEHVSAGQRIAMFHDPRQVWVEANVRETDVRLLEPGMKADIHVDAYPGRVFHGEIFRIGQAATSKFALLPDPNPSGNFTKITQRLPVRILFVEHDSVLRPGMMVEVDIAVRNH
jgi:membrane fusion protein, multidrug efflux system